MHKHSATADMLPISAFSPLKFLGGVVATPQGPVLWDATTTPVPFQAFPCPPAITPINQFVNYQPAPAMDKIWRPAFEDYRGVTMRPALPEVPETSLRPALQELPEPSSPQSQSSVDDDTDSKEDVTETLECAQALTDLKWGTVDPSEKTSQLLLALQAARPAFAEGKGTAIRGYRLIEAKDLGKLVVRGPKKDKRDPDFYIKKVLLHFS
uniref:Coding region for putative polypeptide 2 protein n=1 Tax=Alcelaphine gammaherpesvirus 1 TaxID=35252 RepID=Q64922_9GAMA|nr:coding region for putative polypeptide 2 [Alcelaphine gammaherpesvirus 1]